MKIIYNKKMADCTTFKIGGEAEVFVEPNDIGELVKTIKFLRDNRYIYYILGNGSNVLISDKGIKGCVVHIGKNISKIKVDGTRIEAEAGATLWDIAREAKSHNLTGFERLSGIPGTIGGAVAMNAGAYGKEMKDIVSSVNAINDDGRVVKLSNAALEFSYRKSVVAEKGFIVTSVVLNLEEGNRENIEAEMEKHRLLREGKQPLEYASAGSTFKRPENNFASQLIEQSHLRGECVGDAEVSEKHAGFIINKGKAKAQDVYKLIQKVQNTVMTYFNVMLELEIKLWGKFK